MQKVLVLGATGAMGMYLVPELVSMGYQVDAVSLDERVSDHPNLTYIQANAKDMGFLAEILQNNYDAMVDFMVYHTPEFRERYMLLLESVRHYIYLSSYRVYADEQHPVTETAPRLLDVSDDEEFLATDDYSLHKARGENMLLACGRSNWTIVRPSIVYSKYRYQLVSLEAMTHVYRMLHGKTVVLPKEALPVQATMTWAGDVAKMLARLVLNEKAYGEAYTLATAEHHSWGEIAEYYAEIGGMKYVTTDLNTYMGFRRGEQSEHSPIGIGVRSQVLYDRMAQRVIDNRKILAATGLKQEDFMPLKEGLRLELQAVDKGYPFAHFEENDRMDAWLKAHGYGE